MKLIKFCQFSYIHLKYIHPECTYNCLFRPIANFFTLPYILNMVIKKSDLWFRKIMPLLCLKPCPGSSSCTGFTFISMVSTALKIWLILTSPALLSPQCFTLMSCNQLFAGPLLSFSSRPSFHI